MFFFETHGFRFERDHRFKGKLTAEHQRALKLNTKQDEFWIEFVRHPECKFPPADQSGMVYLTIAGDFTESREAALTIVATMAHQISFSHKGSLKILPGLITGERIPENEREQAEVADKPCFAELLLVEYEEPPSFDPASLSQISMSSDFALAIRQFNAATQATNTIDRYLGFFKVLESLFVSKNKKILPALRNAEPLRAAARELTEQHGGTMTDEDFAKFLRDLVKARDRCAHLRADGGVGVVPGMEEVRSEIEPLCNDLKALTHACITREMLARQQS